jgi:drug/metabolite transporter (DMT)-like permease
LIGEAPVSTVSRRIYVLIVLMVLLWSANFVVAKVALREMKPLELSALRTTLAALMILPIYLWSKRDQLWSNREHGWTMRDVPVLVSLGVFGVALNQVFFVYGLSQTSVSHSSLVIALTPMLVLLIASMMGQEKVTAKKLLGMTIALAGVATLQFRGGAGAGNIIGNGLVLLGAITFAAFTVAGKDAAMRHGSITVNTFAYVGGAIALAPVTLWHGVRYSFGNVSMLGWTSLIYMALFPSVICYLIYYYVLSHIPASRVSAFAYLQPLFATMIALPILGESLSSGVLLGGSLVLAGVWLTERA